MVEDPIPCERNPPEQYTGLQGDGGACGAEGGDDLADIAAARQAGLQGAIYLAGEYPPPEDLEAFASFVPRYALGDVLAARLRWI